MIALPCDSRELLFLYLLDALTRITSRNKTHSLLCFKVFCSFVEFSKAGLTSNESSNSCVKVRKAFLALSPCVQDFSRNFFTKLIPFILFFHLLVSKDVGYACKKSKLVNSAYSSMPISLRLGLSIFHIIFHLSHFIDCKEGTANKMKTLLQSLSSLTKVRT